MGPLELDINMLDNFWPMSYIPFLGKVFCVCGGRAKNVWVELFIWAHHDIALSLGCPSY